MILSFSYHIETSPLICTGFYVIGNSVIKEFVPKLECLKYVYKQIRYHLFRTYAKFSEKLTFLTPDMHTYMCVSEGKKY